MALASLLANDSNHGILGGPEVAPKAKRVIYLFQCGGPSQFELFGDICIMRNVYTDAINHDPANTFIQTGSQIAGRPSGTERRPCPSGHLLPSAGTRRGIQISQGGEEALPGNETSPPKIVDHQEAARLEDLCRCERTGDPFPSVHEDEVDLILFEKFEGRFDVIPHLSRQVAPGAVFFTERHRLAQ